MAFRTRKLLKDDLLPDPKKNHCRKKCSRDNNICPDDDACNQRSPFPPTPPPPPSWTQAPPQAVASPTSHHVGGHFKITTFLLVVLGVLAPAVVFLTCYAAYKLYFSGLRRRSSLRRDTDDGTDIFVDSDHGPEPAVDHPIWYIRTVGLDSAAIGAITAVQYRKGDTIIDGTDCAVCLNEFREDETLRLLPKCSHAFHAPCIDTWLRSHTSCPLCRAGIFRGGDTAAASPSDVGEVEESGGYSDETMIGAGDGVIGSDNKQGTTTTEIAGSAVVVP